MVLLAWQRRRWYEKARGDGRNILHVDTEVVVLMVRMISLVVRGAFSFSCNFTYSNNLARRVFL